MLDNCFHRVKLEYCSFDCWTIRHLPSQKKFSKLLTTQILSRALQETLYHQLAAPLICGQILYWLLNLFKMHFPNTPNHIWMCHCPHTFGHAVYCTWEFAGKFLFLAFLCLNSYTTSWTVSNHISLSTNQLLC